MPEHQNPTRTRFLVGPGPKGRAFRAVGRENREFVTGEPVGHGVPGVFRQLAGALPFVPRAEVQPFSKPIGMRGEGLDPEQLDRFNSLTRFQRAAVSLESPEMLVGLLGSTTSEQFNRLFGKEETERPVLVSEGQKLVTPSTGKAVFENPRADKILSFNVRDIESGQVSAMTEGQLRTLLDQDPRRFQIVQGGDREPARPFRAVDADSKKEVFVTPDEFAKTPGRFLPPPQGAEKNDPVLAARREADLGAALRREALAKRGLQDVPFLGLFDTKTGKPAALSSELLTEINTEVDEGLSRVRPSAPTFVDQALDVLSRLGPGPPPVELPTPVDPGQPAAPAREIRTRFGTEDEESRRGVRPGASTSVDPARSSPAQIAGGRRATQADVDRTVAAFRSVAGRDPTQDEVIQTLQAAGFSLPE